jgi:GH35 family endo-1,4-beta-xylanase
MKKIILASMIILFINFLCIIDVIAQVSDVERIESQFLERASQNIEKYRKGEVIIQFKKESGEVIRNTKVRISQKTHDFLFGAIIFDLIRSENSYRPELFKQRFKELFNFAVFPFYWPSYERRQGMPEWQNIIPVIEWCKLNGITTKGHPLVWACRAGTPQWLSSLPIDLSEELLKARVMNIVRGFRGLIDIWDVVNEPVNVKAWSNTETKEDYIQEPINKIVGYVEKSFKWAYDANPQATLILNEFNTIFMKDVRERFFELVKELKNRRTPISGLGIQAHEPFRGCVWYSPKDLWETFDYLGSFGYSIHITEFIPQSSGKEIEGQWRKGNWNLETQAEFAEQFYRLCFGHPDVTSINWWGVSDRNIWQAGGGLLTEEYQPKPVYNRLLKLIHDEWKTKIETMTDVNGGIKFKGFYGKYDIVLETESGRSYLFDIHIRKDEENKWVFTVEE